MEPDSTVGSQHRGQLIAADIHGNHLLTAALQQDLGEASCRSTRVEGSSCHAELEVIKRTDELVGTARDIVIIRGVDGSRRRHLLSRPLDNRTVDDDLAGLDHGLRMATRPGQPAPDQLAIQALSHCSARLAIVTLIVRAVQCFVQRLMGFGEPIVMIGKRRRVQVGKPAQRVFDRGMAGRRRAGSQVCCRIVDLPLVRLGHCSSGSEAFSDVAALRSGF
jgi:hypothetical protein